MNSEDYRRTAATCLALAKNALDPKERDAFLEIVAEFEKRAEHLERQQAIFGPPTTDDDKAD